jgi:thiol-disulfide isomerase/thioredoxin
MQMRNRLLTLIITTLTVSQIIAQITPYERPYEVNKVSRVGDYPKIKEVKPWDGRTAGDYSIKIQLKGLQEGEIVFLADHHIGGKYLRDTAIVGKKGMAEFTGNRLLQRGMYLFVLPQKKDYFEFLIGDDQDFTLKGDTSWTEHNYYKTMKAIGSDENEWFINYQLSKTNIIEKLIEVDQQIKKDSSEENLAKWNPVKDELLKEKTAYDSVFISQHPNSMIARFLYALKPIKIPEAPKKEDGTIDSNFAYQYYKAHFWDHVDFNEDALVRMPINLFKDKLDEYFDKVIIPDADSCINACNYLLLKAQNSIENEKYLIWYLTNHFESSKIMGLDRVFVHMAMSQYCAGRTWWVDSTTVARMCDNAYRRSYSLIGAQARDLQLKNERDEWINTNGIEAPFTIVMFWDPTCGHCKEAMPKIAEIYKNNKDKGWKVVTLASGNKRKEWLEYLEEHKEISEFTNLIRGEVLEQKYADNLQSYYVIASPTIFVLDENKKIVANRIDVDKMEDFINMLADRKKKENN